MHAKAQPNRKPRNPRTPQPAGLLHVDDAQLRIDTVEILTGRCRRDLYRLLDGKKFPEPVRREGSRCVRWRAQDVRAWLRAAGAAA